MISGGCSDVLSARSERSCCDHDHTTDQQWPTTFGKPNFLKILAQKRRNDYIMTQWICDEALAHFWGKLLVNCALALTWFSTPDSCCWNAEDLMKLRRWSAKLGVGWTTSTATTTTAWLQTNLICLGLIFKMWRGTIISSLWSFRSEKPSCSIIKLKRLHLNSRI